MTRFLTILFFSILCACPAQTLVDVYGGRFTLSAIQPGTDPTAVLKSASVDLYSERSGRKYHLDLPGPTTQCILSNSLLDIGRNWLVATVTDWVPSAGLLVTNIFSNEVDRAGWKISAPSSNNLTWFSATMLPPKSWQLNTGSNPTFGAYTGNAMFFKLNINPTNGIQFYQDTLPAWQDTNSVSTNQSAPPLPSGLIPNRKS